MEYKGFINGQCAKYQERDRGNSVYAFLPLRQKSDLILQIHFIKYNHINSDKIRTNEGAL